MNVLHITSGPLSGGAARGATGLHLSLKEKGVSSKILTNDCPNISDDSFISLNNSYLSKVNNLFRAKVDENLSFFYRNREAYIFSTGLIGYNLKKVKEIKGADIIHLHWINGGMVNFKDLLEIDKPIIWTIRDMWPFTGGCHYSMQCDGYKYNCHYCSQLHAKSRYNLASFILKRKKRLFPKKMKIVGISRWLSSKAMTSSVFKCFDIQTIFNNIDSKVFSPVNKTTARELLGIYTDKKILLCGAIRLNDFYKGFKYYIDALKKLDRDKYLLVFFGNFESRIVETLGFEYLEFGYLSDEIFLRTLYSSADVFIAPSVMEAFGKTLAESMSCGTPVVCFDATGPKDIVDHKINGYRARAFSSSDLATGIEWVVNCESYQNLVNNGVLKIKNSFDSSIIADQYIKLYSELNET